jgi:hypothetical protein
MVHQVRNISTVSTRADLYFDRPNTYMAGNGLCLDGVNLATRMMENLHIDFSRKPSERAYLDDDLGRLSSTQPITPINDVQFEWERPHQMFASQPTETAPAYDSQSVWASLAEDPTMSQFAPHPHLSLSLVCFRWRHSEAIVMVNITADTERPTLQRHLPGSATNALLLRVLFPTNPSHNF